MVIEFQLLAMGFRLDGFRFPCLMHFSSPRMFGCVILRYLSLVKTNSSGYSKYFTFVSHFFTAISQALNIDFCSGV